MLPEAAALRDEVCTRYHVSADDVHVVRSPYRICPLGATSITSLAG